MNTMGEWAGRELGTRGEDLRREMVRVQDLDAEPERGLAALLKSGLSFVAKVLRGRGLVEDGGEVLDEVVHRETPGTAVWFAAEPTSQPPYPATEDC